MDIQTATQLPLVAGLAAVTDDPTSVVELVFKLLVIAVGLASLYFWYIAFNRLIAKQELIPYQRSECVLGFIDLVAIFIVWMGSQAAVGIALIVVVGPQAMEDGGTEDLFARHGILLLYMSAAFGLATLVISAAYLVIRYKTANSFGVRFNELKKQIGYGVVVFIMLQPVVLLIQLLLSWLVPYDHPIMSVLASDPSFVSIFGCWATAVLTAPLLEEFVYRGTFQHWLERLSVSKTIDNGLLFGDSSDVDNASEIDAGYSQSIQMGKLDEANGVASRLSVAEPVATNDSGATIQANDLNPYQAPRTKASDPFGSNSNGLANQRKFAYWPIFVSALLFALAHWGHGLAPIPLFILALGLGYLFRQTGSLIACITVHFLLNFYSMLVFTIIILMGETP